jgi:hypothetical protein
MNNKNVRAETGKGVGVNFGKDPRWDAGGSNTWWE